MKFDSNLPIYIQIMDYIKRRIAAGQLKGEDKLPSVRELSSKLKVNPNTIQRSYQELERESLIFTQRGRGSFVTEDKEAIKRLKKDMAKNLMNQFIESMKSLGFTSDDIIELIKEGVGRGSNG